jgi:hypothetical protein
MKKIKILVLLLAVSAALFYSCSDSNPIENEVVASKSISLRTTLNEIKQFNNISGKNSVTTLDQAFCFNFVFPITLSYNNGTQITVATYQGLLEVLSNESTTLYIEGIVFPFQVQEEGMVTTIHNEEEFFTLIQSCDNFTTVNDFIFDFTCYSIVYPISIINSNHQTIIVNNQTELIQLISSPAGTVNYELNIVFPITVIQNNQSIVINDLYEFFDLNNDCTASSCLCPTVYQPVCVQTPTGIVEFSNSCFAQCAGYTQNDFVDCNSTSCPCPTNFDPVCVQTSAGIVQYDNACRAECAGFTSADFVSCGTNPTGSFGQLLGSCFFIAYPAQVQAGGALVTINNDGECLQYWNAAQPMPNFHYPITVTFAGAITTYTFANQAEFQAEIDTHCN